MQRLFFATADDLMPVFERVEAKRRLIYTVCGLHSTREHSSVSSGSAIPTLRSPAPFPNAIACPQYLVTAADHRITIRDIPQKSGGIRYAIDQLANFESITIQPGGIYPPNVLLHGRVGSASSSDFSKQIYRAFTAAITKYFQRVQAFYVGPQAYELWKSGYRLTPAVQSPKEYDLAV
jgi:hypothetical protein